MSEFITVLVSVLPVLCVALAGMLLRHLQWLNAEADASLLRVTLFLLMPCLILDTILGNAALARPSNILLPPLLGFLTVPLGILMTRLVLGMTGLKGPRERRSFLFSVAIYNYGFIPIPLALLLFSRETAGVLFLFNVGVETALWTVGLAVLQGADKTTPWRRLVNPPTVAIVTALIINSLPLSRWLPSLFHPVSDMLGVAVHMLGQSAIPLGLILIGATLYDHRKRFVWHAGGRVMLWACAVRVGLLPLVLLWAARQLPLSEELQRVILLEAGMPAAVFPLVIIAHYGGDITTALRVVVSTSLVSLVTIPLWIRFGMKWLGLAPM